MQTQMIRGILFDKDGTLFDFEKTWAKVLDDTLDALTDDPELKSELGRRTGFDPVAKSFVPGSLSVAGALDAVAADWSRDLPGLGAGDVLRIAEQIADDAVAAGALVPAVPDLVALLAELRHHGYVLGVATHDSETAARTHLAKAGALAHFSFIAGFDSGHGLKPGPGMLLAFAEATGLQPGEVAMVGDSVHDLGVAPAAKAAMAVGVLTGPARRGDLAPYADHILDSIGDLPRLLGHGQAARA